MKEEGSSYAIAGLVDGNYHRGKKVFAENYVGSSKVQRTDHVMAFKTAPNALVIGSTTAWADGNVSRITWPGRVETRISGIGVHYPDGTEPEGWIVPDIEVKPTIQGISERRDERLERAIAIIMED